MNLNQVTIQVRNVELSIAFYERLGLKLIVRALPHYARFECPEGDSTFSLHEEGEEIRPGAWIYFEVQQVDEFVSELVEKGFVFDELPQDKSWLWREARLQDPDGNLLILYTAGTNRKNPPWRI